MKKSLLKIAALLSVAGFVATQAREIRTPLPFMYGKMRYPVEYHWESEKKNDQDCWNINFEAFGGAYSRCADAAYSTCNGRTTVPWTNLIFGKSEFRLEEAFVNADVGTISADNPWLSVSTLNTKYDYHERGAVFGATISSTFDYCDEEYRFGLRARLPFRDITVADTCGLSDLIGAQLDEVYREREETTTGVTQTNTVYAARLDFLTALKRIATPIENLVNYNNSGNIQIADQNIDAAVNQANGQPIVGAIYRADGSAPVAVDYWGKQAVFDAAIDASGGGLANNQRGNFVASTNYSTTLAGDTAAQSKLWIVPTLKGSGAGGNENKLQDGALAIQSAINLAIKNLDSSVQDFIREQGLDFCDGRNKGLGDLDLEFFLGRNWGCDGDVWTDLMLAFRLPTSDVDCDLQDCKKVLKQPLGNNDHFEIRFGAAGGYDFCDWLKFMGDLSFSWAIEDEEQIAAPFSGATVKGIGPCVKADIDWWYLVGHFDMTFFANDCCGFDVGYEIYHKGSDDVSLCVSKATDFAGRTDQALAASIFTKDTERTSHKLRTGFFSVIGDCQIFAGWSHVLAGKNAPRETDWYISMDVSF